jgi:hypothetical protein
MIMKVVLPLIIVIATALLIVLGAVLPGSVSAAGVASTGASASRSAATPEQAVDQFLNDLRRHDWHAAYGRMANTGGADEALFTRDVSGTNGSLRTFSSLNSWELQPLHASDQQAQVRARLRWSTAVGSVDDVRDLQVLHQGQSWKVVWPVQPEPDIPAQVIPVTFLRWDVVSSTAADRWGERNVDAPHVRILSMNAIPYNDGTVVMGEVVNEDTIPAFVNVNAILNNASGNPMANESSFDKIVHVLLPKGVSPYRIDFPNTKLQDVKNVRMDVKATLVPAAADPVIGVMDQQIATEAGDRRVLRGKLFNQGGQVVNIPHVIATFYGDNGKVVWVADGYPDRALLPQTPESFAVEIPKSIAAKIDNFHVVVNAYSRVP